MANRKFRFKRGGNRKMNRKYNTLDLNNLNNKKTKIVSSEEALKDISPINWSKEVLSGEKKINIDKR